MGGREEEMEGEEPIKIVRASVKESDRINTLSSARKRQGPKRYFMPGAMDVARVLST